MERKARQTIKIEDIKKDADKKGCLLQRCIFYTSEFLDGPMCGRCFPCSMGSYEARIILKTIEKGHGTEEDLAKLKRIAEDMLVASMCKRGKDTARFMLEWIDTDAFRAHIDGYCPEKQCRAFIKFIILPERCTMCGRCKAACKYNAIHGETPQPFKSGYLPFEIRQSKCVRCGECVGACPEGAILKVDIREAEVSAIR